MASKIYPSVRPEDGSSRLQANASSREIRDRLKLFTKSGGSLRGIPDALRIQLLRDAKA